MELAQLSMVVANRENNFTNISKLNSFTNVAKLTKIELLGLSFLHENLNEKCKYIYKIGT